MLRGVLSDPRGPAEQLQVEFFEGHLRGVGEGGGDLACGRVQLGFAGELDAHPEVRVFGDDVQREQASRTGSCPLRRWARVREIHRAVQFFCEQRRARCARSRASRPAGSAAGWSEKCSGSCSARRQRVLATRALIADLRLAAGLQPVRGGGVQLHPFGQRDGRRAHVCLGEHPACERALLGESDADIKPGRGARRGASVPAAWPCFRLPVSGCALIDGSNGSAGQPSRSFEGFSEAVLEGELCCPDVLVRSMLRLPSSS